jgi:UDP-N-acetylmuramoyl-L-alanyl-D-glutamate--2,6-diaminopimelate ligase
MGHKTGIISTVQTKIGNKVIVSDPHVTTPSSDEVAAIVTKMQKAHCTHIIIEASSQGLVSDRLIGIQFDAVTITNVTAEHLDFHKTWINYLNAKKVILKEFLKPKGIAILNTDDRSFKKLCNVSTSARSYSIAPANKAYYHASNIKYKNAETTFSLAYQNHKYQVTISLPGEYNVSNTLGVIGILDSIGIDIPAALSHFASFKGSRGRMQVIQHLPYTVIVDFAHTPNGLQNALKAAALFKSRPENKIIGVIGCSGSRDPYKRVVMGRIAHDIADITIIAPINPRNECQKSINLQVITGWKHGYDLKEHKELYVSDLYELPTENRRDAFRQALKIAEPGDVVIATGKGHQNDICDNHNTYEWSDIEEFQKLLNETS